MRHERGAAFAGVERLADGARLAGVSDAAASSGVRADDAHHDDGDTEPVGELGDELADAIRAIEDAAADRIAVCDQGTFIGVITAADLVELDEVLDRTSRPPGGER